MAYHKGENHDVDGVDQKYLGADSPDEPTQIPWVSDVPVCRGHGYSEVSCMLICMCCLCVLICMCCINARPKTGPRQMPLAVPALLGAAVKCITFVAHHARLRFHHCMGAQVVSR